MSDSQRYHRFIKEYDVMRSSIEAIIKNQGDLTKATEKLKGLINPNDKNDIRLNQMAGKFDKAQKGILSASEFRAFLESLKEISLSDDQKTLVSNLADLNHDGLIQYDDFIMFLKADIRVDKAQSSSQ